GGLTYLTSVGTAAAHAFGCALLLISNRKMHAITMLCRPSTTGVQLSCDEFHLFHPEPVSAGQGDTLLPVAIRWSIPWRRGPVCCGPSLVRPSLWHTP